MKLSHTVPCSRAAETVTDDGFGNEVGEARPEVTFEAVFAPSGSQIVDGVLREATVSKPTLYVVGLPDVRSGDRVTVDGDAGWQVDGDPAVWPSPYRGRPARMVLELRRVTG